MSWPQVRLGTVAHINPRTPLPDDVNVDSTVSFIPMAAVSEQTFSIEIEETRQLGDVSKGYTSFQRGDVLLAKITPCFENGKLAIANIQHQYGYGSTEFHVIRTHADKLIPEYIFHYLRQEHIRFVGEKRMTGSAGQRRVPAAFLQELQIPLPPLAEQRRIAAILDCADALRAKRRAALAKLDTLLQATFLDMFRGQEKEAWTIGDLLDDKLLLLHKDGNHGANYPRAEEFGNEGIPFISAKCITNSGSIDEALVEYLNEEKAKQLKIGWLRKGDVLLAHNASVGKVGLYNGLYPQALIGTSLTAYRPNPRYLSSEYLFFALKSEHFQRQLSKNMSQTTRNQVPITAQRRLSVIIPPKQQQDAFARIAIKTLQQRSRMEVGITTLNTLFYSLQQRAFRGELDVVLGES